MTLDDEASVRAWLSSLPEFTPTAIERLGLLVELLADENERQNLVSAASLTNVWVRHIADSAQLLRYVSRGTAPWLDLGSGAGFPGLVVAALRPDVEVVMVESRARRIDWLERVCREMALENASIQGRRLELVPDRTMRVISARAFAPLEQLLRLSERFSTTETIWLLPKGRSAAQELSDLSGWAHTFHVEQSLTDEASGIIVGRLVGNRKDGHQ
jgi:16S rRNA (guanine527-N7)-methyltransferase